MTRFMRFGVVGTLGFVIDAGSLIALVSLLNIAPLPARMGSFLIAATVTFALNQRFTFQLRERFDVYRWLSYLATTAVGACVNVGVYHIWITMTDATPKQLVVGTAFGSLLAMCVNYFASSTLVFRPTKRFHFINEARK